MTHISELPTPALLIDRRKLLANIARMARRATDLGVSLRPHIKTHKSPSIARLQLEEGACGITVSTLYEARAFADEGFSDIMWAFPLILHRTAGVAQLARRIDLAVVVDSPEAVAALVAQAAELRVFIKVDCGYHRAGVDPEGDQLRTVADAIVAATHLRLGGILTHAGHSYAVRGRERLLQVARQERDVMRAAASRLSQWNIEVPFISVGSTPTMSVIDDLAGIDEIRPGNYVFYDHTQMVLGSCGVEDCALTVLTSVVSAQPGGDHSIVDAGALSMSKDAGPTALGHATMGAVFSDYDAACLSEDVYLTALSQEHGHLSCVRPVGERLRILPNHSCLTAAQFDEYIVVEGEQVVDRWPILRGRSTAVTEGDDREPRAVGSGSPRR